MSKTLWLLKTMLKKTIVWPLCSLTCYRNLTNKINWMKRVFLESLPVFQVCFPVTLWWAKGSVLLSQITVSQRLANWKCLLVKYTGTLLLKGIVEASNKSRRQIKWPDCSVDVHSHQRMNHKHFGQEPTPQSAHDNLIMMTGHGWSYSCCLKFDLLSG